MKFFILKAKSHFKLLESNILSLNNQAYFFYDKSGYKLLFLMIVWVFIL